MTNMIQACSNFHWVRACTTNTLPDEINVTWTTSECGTSETVTARSWPWRSGKSPENVLRCSLFSRKRPESFPDKICWWIMGRICYLGTNMLCWKPIDQYILSGKVSCLTKYIDDGIGAGEGRSDPVSSQALALCLKYHIDPQDIHKITLFQAFASTRQTHLWLLHPQDDLIHKTTFS